MGAYSLTTARTRADAARALFSSVFWNTKRERIGQASNATAFRRFFAIKLFCTFMTVWGFTHTGSWVHAAAIVATLAMYWENWARVGVICWLALVSVQVVRSWPYTLNHFFLESIILGVLAVSPLRRGAQASRWPTGALWTLVLSVWFFAGVQKVVHGYYLDGEYFALAITSEPEGVGQSLRLLLEGVHKALGTSPSHAFPVSSSTLALSLNRVERVTCLLAAWVVVAAELGIPLLAALPRTRTLGVKCLLSAQVGIALISREHDFALTGLGLGLLGMTRSATIPYLGLSALAIVLHLPPTWT